MIKLKLVMTGDEAMRWKELLTSLTSDKQFPDMSAEDSFVCDYVLNTENWDDTLRKAESVAFLLRNANIFNLEFEEWDRGTAFLQEVARAHGIMNDLYSAIEMCPDWKPPPIPKKGWWQKVREWWSW